MSKPLLLLPGPVPVSARVLEAMARPMIDHRGSDFAQLLERLENSMRPLFGTSGDVLFLGSSGTGGLEAAIVNSFSSGDRLLAAPVGVFGKRLVEIAREYGCEVDELDTPLGSAVDAGQLRERLHGARRYAGVLLTHNETSTGVQNDMAALAGAVRDSGALSIVDSVSGLGATRFEMDAWGYDVVVSASQKALAAPPGVAMIAVSERAWKAMESKNVARYYFDLCKARTFARKGQTPWTPPISVFFALDVALREYLQSGIDKNCARLARYSAAIRDAFTALDCVVFSRPDAHSVTVVAASPPDGVDASAVLQALRAMGVVLSGGQGELAGKIVRFGTMGELGEYDILGAIATIERALDACGHRVAFGSGVAAAQAALGRR